MTSSAVHNPSSELSFGLIGRELSYSLSPRIHNFSFQRLGIQGNYLCYEFADPDPIKDFLGMMFTKGALGFNVTQPYKKILATMVKTDLASVNTLQRTSHGWVGHSTDAIGFQQSLRHAWQVQLQDFSRVLFFGSGGAVDAILEEIKKFATQPQIMIMGRAELNANQSFQRVQSFIGDSSLPMIVIHATSASANPLLPVLPALKSKHVYFADLNYQKDRRFLYDWALQQGLPALDGLPMLIEQARAAQMIWLGCTVPYQDLLQELSQNL